jgi:hypothetical protein
LHAAKNGPFEPSLRLTDALFGGSFGKQVGSRAFDQAAALTAVRRERALDPATYLRFFIAGAG